ncbi:homocysteine S-methyltransferase [Macrococcus brunensis]|uniref:homocysteine S-methyltransferase n=1 Tax=Macrococcus brunensis TaxID=198483 RepID=UPI001EF06D8D|nr:homocysteine S-methyltransferase [Macrococcus brunensis]ULG72388.1 homocysteine S-methyltransferase [Macrococcus brunensis]
MQLQDKLGQEIILLDGGFGTTVEQFGYDVNHFLWSSNLIESNPEAVYQVHQAFVDAGAEIILTNTYQAAIQSFINMGLNYQDARNYLKKAVEIARRAAKENTIIAGSLGPYGAMLGNGAEYTGDYIISEQDYIDYHKERLDILIEAGISVFAFETIPNLEEIKAVKKLLEEYEEIEAWLSVTLNDSTHLSDGTQLDEVIETVNAIPNVLAFGINCTSIKVIDEAVDKLIKQSSKDIILYPNGGRKYDASNKVWIGDEEQSLLEAAVRWKDKGVKFIGGCCQVGPDDIKELKASL